MPAYVLFMIFKLGTTPPDMNTLRKSFEVKLVSEWKIHSIIFRKEEKQTSSDNSMKKSVLH